MDLRVAALTGGRTVPSARFRVEQFVAPLRASGVALDLFPSHVGAYPPASAVRRPWWLARTLADRVPAVLASHRYDVTLLQRELVSTLSTLERFTGSPRVFDVDDAIWLYRGGAFVRRIVRRCDAVMCGNGYLAEYFRRLHENVVELPTAVDTERFTPAVRPRIDDAVVIGWSGTSGGYVYFAPVVPALAEVMRRYPQVRLRIVSNHPPDFPELDGSRVDFIPWSETTEVSASRGFDIGIMPLVDSEWDRGKCSYKMLLYMACGLPSVVSPIGMNVDVLSMGPVGLPAMTTAEWVSSLSELVEDAALRGHMGREARRVVVERFSLTALAPRLAAVLREVAA